MRAAPLSSSPAAQDTLADTHTHTHTHTPLTGLGGVAARCCHSQSELANLHVNEAWELSSSRLTGAPGAPPHPSLTGLGGGEWGGLRTGGGKKRRRRLSLKLPSLSPFLSLPPLCRPQALPRVCLPLSPPALSLLAQPRERGWGKAPRAMAEEAAKAGLPTPASQGAPSKSPIGTHPGADTLGWET